MPGNESTSKRRFRIVERVVFEYVWTVDAESSQMARRWCLEHGDGESAERNELSRRFVECDDIGEAAE